MCVFVIWNTWSFFKIVQQNDSQFCAHDVALPLKLKFMKKFQQMWQKSFTHCIFIVHFIDTETEIPLYIDVTNNIIKFLCPHICESLSHSIDRCTFNYFRLPSLANVSINNF